MFVVMPVGANGGSPETVTNGGSPLRIHEQKLELTWMGKENRPKLGPRILHRVNDKDIFNNILIFGDNLPAHIAVVGANGGSPETVTNGCSPGIAVAIRSIADNMNSGS